MKYWLIFMIFGDDGEFIRKIELPTPNAERCYVESAKQAIKFTNTGYLTQAWCVTDDHYMGRKQDKHIPYD
jgi:hypothetical protein